MDDKERFQLSSQFIKNLFDIVSTGYVDAAKKLLHAQVLLILKEDQKNKVTRNIKIVMSEFINSIKEGRGRTSLHIACACGREEMVDFLIEFGSNVEDKDDYDNTPLFIATEHNHENLVKKLIETYKANYNHVRKGVSLLHLSAMNSLNLTQYFIEKGLDINAVSNYGTPIVGAFLKSQIAIAKYLHSKGANLVDIGQFPPLIHLAIDSNNLELAIFLSSTGYDLNLKDSDGWSALQFAAEKGSIDFIEFLLQNKADPAYVNKGVNFYQVSKKFNQTKLTKFIEQYLTEQKQVALLQEYLGDKQVKLTSKQLKELQKQAEQIQKEGETLFHAKKYEEALNKYNQALSIFETSELLANKASCLYYMKQYKETIDFTIKQRKINKEELKLHFFEGKSYEELDQYSEAAATYFEALQVEVNQSLAKHERKFQKLFGKALKKGKQQHEQSLIKQQ